jgi:hypothetical protein
VPPVLRLGAVAKVQATRPPLPPHPPPRGPGSGGDNAGGRGGRRGGGGGRAASVGIGRPPRHAARLRPGVRGAAEGRAERPLSRSDRGGQPRLWARVSAVAGVCQLCACPNDRGGRLLLPRSTRCGRGTVAHGTGGPRNARQGQHPPLPHARVQHLRAVHVFKVLLVAIRSIRWRRPAARPPSTPRSPSGRGGGLAVSQREGGLTWGPCVGAGVVRKPRRSPGSLKRIRHDRRGRRTARPAASTKPLPRGRRRALAGRGCLG